MDSPQAKLESQPPCITSLNEYRLLQYLAALPPGYTIQIIQAIERNSYGFDPSDRDLPTVVQLRATWERQLAEYCRCLEPDPEVTPVRILG